MFNSNTSVFFCFTFTFTLTEFNFFLFFFSLLGVGFKELLQELINTGVVYGSRKIEDVLVSRKTLIETVIPEEYKFVKMQLRGVLNSNFVSFSVDLWSNEEKNRSF